MLALKVFRDKAKGLSDLLPYAFLVNPGTVLLKSGTIIRGLFFSGKDPANCSEDELNAITGTMNTALIGLSGCAFWLESVRVPVVKYPERSQSSFPDTITRMIDEEHRQTFTEADTHFETFNALIIAYTPPLNRQTRIINAMFEKDGQSSSESMADQHLAHLDKLVENFMDRLSGTLDFRPMQTYFVEDAYNRTHRRDELLNFLNFCITGLRHAITIPPVPMQLDQYLGGQEVEVGSPIKVGDHYVATISIDGFPHTSYPNILARLNSLNIAHRWSTRFIGKEQHESQRELTRGQRKWKQKERGFLAQTFKMDGMQNRDALQMSDELEASIQTSNSGQTLYGYYTPVIVLMDEDPKKLMENARILVREIQRDGFNARVETVNTMAAYLGSLPGHLEPNVRRIMINSLNLSDLLQLYSVWTGSASCPCPLYPENSPPLLQAVTVGLTPFNFNLHVEDVGHTLVFGPTGAGKSTLLAYIIAQFRRYQGASIFAFDKGNSLWALAHAAGGKHYEIGAERTPCFTPLAVLETSNEMSWAQEWIATCYQLQTGLAPTPYQREAIHKAMVLFRDTVDPQHRSLSDFVSTLQEEELRAALAYYTCAGVVGKLLDNEADGLQNHPFVVLEIEELMAMGDKTAIPVLLYLFRRFERSLKGQPALLVLDEAWLLLGHPVFREKIREWLKVLRKANCAVIMATQSLSDAIKSGIFDVLVESCPTKLLLPNEEADKTGTDQHPGPRDLYEIMGLNESQIQLLKYAVKKRHYYYLSPLGRQLIDLKLGPVALSFVAVSDKESLSQLRRLKAGYGDEWPYIWMKQRGVNYEHLV